MPGQVAGGRLPARTGHQQTVSGRGNTHRREFETTPILAGGGVTLTRVLLASPRPSGGRAPPWRRSRQSRRDTKRQVRTPTAGALPPAAVAVAVGARRPLLLSARAPLPSASAPWLQLANLGLCFLGAYVTHTSTIKRFFGSLKLRKRFLNQRDDKLPAHEESRMYP